MAGVLLVPICGRAQTRASLAPPDASTRLHIRASRTPVAIVVDGRLDEVAWINAAVTSGFLQVEPEQNSPAKFRTEVRVLFDSVNIYVAMRALDQDARHELRSPELARDFNSGDTDFFGMALDPFADRRNALLFETSPYEAIQDIQAFDGRIEIEQWDAKWKVRTKRDAEGWTAEYSIPWTSIRYPSDGRAWGVNFYRRARHANELSAWAPWPRNLQRFRMDYAGDIDGLEPPTAHTNVRARPYVLAQTVRDGANAPSLGNASVKAGGEVTWAPGPNSVLDVTVNTDFAQTDVDQQVVNLKRFSVFFPERRQFFLESANVFETGLVDNNFVFRPFFSRTIGLDFTGATVPIVGGARFVERSASEAIGALLVHQEGSDSQGPSTFAVGRYSRYLGDGSRIGALGAVRLDDAGPGDSPGRRSYVGALDGFTRLSPETTLDGSVSPFFDSNGKHGLGAHTYITRQTQSLLTSLYVVLVTKDYNPPTGFVSRTNVVVAATTIRGDLRPRWRPRIVRSFQPGLTNYGYLTPSSLGLQEAVTTLNFNSVFQTGAQFNVYALYQNERPSAPVAFLPTVTVPQGAFNFARVGTSLTSDPSAPLSGQLQVEAGGFYDGTLTRIAPSFRFVPDPRISLAATYEINQLRDVGGVGNHATTHLLQPTVRLGLNPRTLLTAFYQYNSTTGTGSLNARFSWEFMPLSYLFIVYNDLRAAGALSPFTTPTKSLTAKLSYLLQW